MNDTQRDAIARTKFLSADKRSRVIMEDQIEFLEAKMRAIKKLMRTFPAVKAWRPR